VQADFDVELGPNDDALELPWSSEEGGVRYYDLKRHPELLPHIEEARDVPELSDFLAAVNAHTSILETVKCDTWASTEINPEEEIFEGTHKFGSYVDLLFSDQQARHSFPEHERLATQLVQRLQQGLEIPASAEFIIRRCYYQTNAEESQDGFYITFYLFGYGDDETRARDRWGAGLSLVQNVICHLSVVDV
jgi:hypothetical protein